MRSNMTRLKTSQLTPPYLSPALSWVSLLSSGSLLTDSYNVVNESFSLGSEFSLEGDIEYLD